MRKCDKMMPQYYVSFIILIHSLSVPGVDGSKSEARIHESLFYFKDNYERGYDKKVRPVQHPNDTIQVTIKLRLIQLINVREKDQTMTLNVWFHQKWQDIHLRWNPSYFDNIKQIYLPADMIWRPDLVLYNNADGKYQLTSGDTKATVYFNGTVIWEVQPHPKPWCIRETTGHVFFANISSTACHQGPSAVWSYVCSSDVVVVGVDEINAKNLTPPAIYTSMCAIDVEWFPYDEQNCKLKFGSWTYGADELDLKHWSDMKDVIMTENEKNETIWVLERAIDLSQYHPSNEWDIMSVSGARHSVRYPCCSWTFIDVTYDIRARRKTLFYTVNLTAPTIGLAFLTTIVFYLPAESNEKVVLSVSILVCLTVFFLLLVELIPAISLVIPLIGKYLLFTMMLVGASITATVFSLNFHYRSKSSHLPMSGWIRKWLLNRFPKYLMMHRFSQEEQDEERRKHMLFHPLLSKMAMNSNMKKSVAEIKGGRKSVWAALLPGLMAAASRQPETSSNNSSNSSRRSSSVEKPIKRNFHVEEALMGVAEKVSYLVNKMKHEEECKQVEDEWKFVAMVIDRMFLCIFSVANICGTMTIILNAPAFFDSRTPIDSTH